MGFKTKVTLLTISWYISSILLSIYNKHVISKLLIPYPLFMTSIHQILLYFISLAYIRLKEWYTPSPESNTVVATPVSNKIPWTYRLPVAIFTALDIGFSNLSLKYITLTIYLVIKTSSIAFVLLFSVMFRLEKYDWRLGMIVVVMMLGVSGMTYFQDSNQEEISKRGYFVKEMNNKGLVSTPKLGHGGIWSRRDDVNINKDVNEQKSEFILGVLLVLGSAILGGLRWVITQLILRSNVSHKKKPLITRDPSIPHAENNQNGFSDSRNDLEVGSSARRTAGVKKNPIKTIKQLAPISSLVLFITSLIVERPSIPHFINKICFDNPSSLVYQIKGFFMLLIPGILVFGLTLSEYNILQKTNSSLTLSILGILKEVVTILISMIVLKERLSHGFGQWLSMLVIIGDAIVYNFYKVMENKKKQQEEEDDSLIEDQNMAYNANVMGGMIESIELEQILSDDHV